MDESPMIEALKKHLSNDLAPETITGYVRDIDYCTSFMGAEKMQSANYQDIVNYIGHLRERKYTAHAILRKLAALKRFYSFLVETGLRDDHPCKNLSLKDRQPQQIQIQDLFTSQELEQLMERKERFSKLVTIRNKVIMSLLIYQGLGKSEMVQIQLNHLNLEKGSIDIKNTKQLKNRTLPLKSSQVLLFYKYIYEIRPKLLELSKQKISQQFLLSIRGSNETGEGIKYLVETLQYKFPNRKLSTVTIRQSVITNLLKEGKDIRIVEEFAGHRWLRTTEKYRENNLNELKNIIQKYHPLQ